MSASIVRAQRVGGDAAHGVSRRGATGLARGDVRDLQARVDRSCDRRAGLHAMNPASSARALFPTVFGCCRLGLRLHGLRLRLWLFLRRLRLRRRQFGNLCFSRLRRLGLCWCGQGGSGHGRGDVKAQLGGGCVQGRAGPCEVCFAHRIPECFQMPGPDRKLLWRHRRCLGDIGVFHLLEMGHYLGGVRTGQSRACGKCGGRGKKETADHWIGFQLVCVPAMISQAMPAARASASSGPNMARAGHRRGAYRGRSASFANAAISPVSPKPQFEEIAPKYGPPTGRGGCCRSACPQ